LPCKNNIDEMRTEVQRIKNYVSWSPSYSSVKQLRKNEDLQKASEILRDRLKKLDEDA